MAQGLELLAAEEIADGSLARWAYYGENGVGKSRLAASGPAFNGPDIPSWLVIVPDRENVKEYLGKPHYKIVKIRQWDDLAPLLTFLQQGAKRKQFFRGVIFDTWTRIQAIEIAKIAGFVPPAPGQEAQFILRAPTHPEGYKAWNQVGALAAQWMGYYNELPMHVIHLFQEAAHEASLSQNPFKVEPAMTALATRSVKDALGMIGRLYVELDADAQAPVNLLDTDATKAALHINPAAKETRRLLIGKHPVYFSKGPSDVLGYTVENPTWDKLAVCLPTIAAAR